MTTLPADWPGYAKLANVGPTGTDVAVSGTTYTVKTACVDGGATQYATENG